MSSTHRHDDGGNEKKMIRLIVKTDESDTSESHICCVHLPSSSTPNDGKREEERGRGQRQKQGRPTGQSSHLSSSKSTADLEHVLQQVSSQLKITVESLSLMVFKEGHYVAASTIRSTKVLNDEDIVLATPRLDIIKIEEQEDTVHEEKYHDGPQEDEEEDIPSPPQDPQDLTRKNGTRRIRSMSPLSRDSSTDGGRDRRRVQRRGTVKPKYKIGTQIQCTGVITSIDVAKQQYMIRFNHDPEFEHDVAFDDPHLDKIVVPSGVGSRQESPPHQNPVDANENMTPEQLIARVGGMKRRVSIMLGEDDIEKDVGQNHGGKIGSASSIKQNKQKKRKTISTTNQPKALDSQWCGREQQNGVLLLTDKQRKKLQGMKLDLNKFLKFLTKEEGFAESTAKIISRQVQKMKRGGAVTSKKDWGKGVEFRTSNSFVDMSDKFHDMLEEAIGHEEAYKGVGRLIQPYRIITPLQKLVNYQAYYYHKKFPVRSQSSSSAPTKAEKTSPDGIDPKTHSQANKTSSSSLPSSMMTKSVHKEQTHQRPPTESIGKSSKLQTMKKIMTDDTQQKNQRVDDSDQGDVDDLPDFEMLMNDCRLHLSSSASPTNDKENDRDMIQLWQQQDLPQQRKETEVTSTTSTFSQMKKISPRNTNKVVMSEFYCSSHGEEPLQPSSLMMSPMEMEATRHQLSSRMMASSLSAAYPIDNRVATSRTIIGYDSELDDLFL